MNIIVFQTMWVLLMMLRATSIAESKYISSYDGDTKHDQVEFVLVPQQRSAMGRYFKGGKRDAREPGGGQFVWSGLQHICQMKSRRPKRVVRFKKSSSPFNSNPVIMAARDKSGHVRLHGIGKRNWDIGNANELLSYDNDISVVGDGIDQPITKRYISSGLLLAGARLEKGRYTRSVIQTQEPSLGKRSRFRRTVANIDMNNDACGCSIAMNNGRGNSRNWSQSERPVYGIGKRGFINDGKGQSFGDVGETGNQPSKRSRLYRVDKPHSGTPVTESTVVNSLGTLIPQLAEELIQLGYGNTDKSDDCKGDAKCEKNLGLESTPMEFVEKSGCGHWNKKTPDNINRAADMYRTIVKKCETESQPQPQIHEVCREIVKSSANPEKRYRYGLFRPMNGKRHAGFGHTYQNLNESKVTPLFHHFMTIIKRSPFMPLHPDLTTNKRDQPQSGKRVEGNDEPTPRLSTGKVNGAYFTFQPTKKFNGILYKPPVFGKRTENPHADKSIHQMHQLFSHLGKRGSINEANAVEDNVLETDREKKSRRMPGIMRMLGGKRGNDPVFHRLGTAHMSNMKPQSWSVYEQKRSKRNIYSPILMRLNLNKREDDWDPSGRRDSVDVMDMPLYLRGYGGKRADDNDDTDIGTDASQNDDIKKRTLSQFMHMAGDKRGEQGTEKRSNLYSYISVLGKQQEKRNYLMFGKRSRIESESNRNHLMLGKRSPIDSQSKRNNLMLGKRSPIDSESKRNNLMLGKRSPIDSESKRNNLMLGKRSPIDSESKRNKLMLGKRSPIDSESNRNHSMFGKRSPIDSDSKRNYLMFGKRSPIDSESKQSHLMFGKRSPIDSESKRNHLMFGKRSPIDSESKRNYLMFGKRSPIDSESKRNHLMFGKRSPIDSESKRNHLMFGKRSPIDSESKRNHLMFGKRSPIDSESKRNHLMFGKRSPIDSESKRNHLLFGKRSPIDLESKRNYLMFGKPSPIDSESKRNHLMFGKRSPIDSESKRNHLMFGKRSPIDSESKRNHLMFGKRSSIDSESKRNHLMFGKRSSIDSESKRNHLMFGKRSPIDSESKRNHLMFGKRSPIDSESKRNHLMFGKRSPIDSESKRNYLMFGKRSPIDSESKRNHLMFGKRSPIDSESKRTYLMFGKRSPIDSGSKRNYLMFGKRSPIESESKRNVPLGAFMQLTRVKQSADVADVSKSIDKKGKLPGFMRVFGGKRGGNNRGFKSYFYRLSGGKRSNKLGMRHFLVLGKRGKLPLKLKNVMFGKRDEFSNLFQNGVWPGIAKKSDANIRQRKNYVMYGKRFVDGYGAGAMFEKISEYREKKAMPVHLRIFGGKRSNNNAFYQVTSGKKWSNEFGLTDNAKRNYLMFGKRSDMVSASKKKMPRSRLLRFFGGKRDETAAEIVEDNNTNLAKRPHKLPAHMRLFGGKRGFNLFSYRMSGGKKRDNSKRNYLMFGKRRPGRKHRTKRSISMDGKRYHFEGAPWTTDISSLGRRDRRNSLMFGKRGYIGSVGSPTGADSFDSFVQQHQISQPGEISGLMLFRPSVSSQHSHAKRNGLMFGKRLPFDDSYSTTAGEDSNDDDDDVGFEYMIPRTLMNKPLWQKRRFNERSAMDMDDFVKLQADNLDPHRGPWKRFLYPRETRNILMYGKRYKGGRPGMKRRGGFWIRRPWKPMAPGI